MKKIITIFLSVLLICSVNILPTAFVAAIPMKAEGSEASHVYTIEERLALLRVKFPHGKYWNHLHTGTGKGDPDVATDTPCYSRSSGYQVVGQYCCNTFDGAMQCMGFAYKMFYDLHGVYGSMQTKRYDVENIQVGDYVRLSYDTHSAIVIARDGDALTVVDCNQSSMGAQYRCHIRWDCQSYSIWRVTYFKHSDAVAQTQVLPDEETEADVLAAFSQGTEWEPEEDASEPVIEPVTEPAAEPVTAAEAEPTTVPELTTAPRLGARPEPAQKTGDVDNDGRVTAADARLALQIAVDIAKGLSDEAVTAADVDGDPGVSASDARQILIVAVGKDSF